MIATPAAQRLGTVLLMAGAAAAQPDGELAKVDALDMASDWLSDNQNNPLAERELLAEAVKIIAATYRVLLPACRVHGAGCWECAAASLIESGHALLQNDMATLRRAGLFDYDYETGL